MQLSSSTVSTTAPVGSTDGSGSTNEIERLQRQLKNLRKSLAELPDQGLPDAQVRQQEQLLSQQIQIVQAQIIRLQDQRGLEKTENLLRKLSEADNNSPTVKAHITDKVIGASPLADIRQQGHPVNANTTAIDPANPPIVSVRA